MDFLLNNHLLVFISFHTFFFRKHLLFLKSSSITSPSCILSPPAVLFDLELEDWFEVSTVDDNCSDERSTLSLKSGGTTSKPLEKLPLTLRVILEGLLSQEFGLENILCLFSSARVILSCGIIEGYRS